MRPPRTSAKYMALDVNGDRLRAGDYVRKLEFGAKALQRKVIAIGDGEHIAGLIRTELSIAWEHPRNFEKVAQ